GHRCTVEGNWFLGEGKRRTGGVRIIGDDHLVINNYFEDLTGDEARAAVSVMNGIPDTPLNGYSQVHRAVVAFNTFVDCKHPLATGVGASERISLPPVDCTIANNLFAIGDRPLADEYAAPQNWTWTGNLRQPAESIPATMMGVTVIDLRFARGADGLLRPTAESPALDAAAGEFPQVTHDIDGQRRDGRKDSGCDELSEAARIRRPLTQAEIGPSWLTREQEAKTPRQ
ncbi:MAG: chondroitinase-B domain-containing protein, partial [Planctomycetaceae bacterium]